MIGSILITVGLALDIIGVALLLAGPRVHARRPHLLLESDDEPVSTLRRWWSRLGRFGLPIVSSGFALQILGAWSQHLEIWWLVVAIIATIPTVFFAAWWLIERLPRGDSIG
ncbi:MAG: hypothetical protein OXG19_04930 [Chloroflexi bacterium]|nr:hypothetical protein [Chloroflexota bacterium]